MNKTWIIIQREFINRVSKKSFILLTILMPFVFAALIFVPLWLSTVKGGDQKQVAVIDETMKYLPQFKDDESYHFVGVPQMEASFRTDSSTFDAVVEIKADLAVHPEAVAIYSRKEVPNSLSRLVSETLDEQVRQDKLLRYDIPQLPSIMQDMNRKLNIRTVKWSDDGTESESNAGAAMAAGIDVSDLHVRDVLRRYGDAKCDGGEDQPHCGSHCVFCPSFPADDWKDCGYRTGRRGPAGYLDSADCGVVGYCG